MAMPKVDYPNANDEQIAAAVRLASIQKQAMANNDNWWEAEAEAYANWRGGNPFVEIPVRSLANVRFNGDPNAIRGQVEQVWKRNVPQVPFGAEFADDVALEGALLLVQVVENVHDFVGLFDLDDRPIRKHALHRLD